MGVRFGFFDSINNDRLYHAGDMSNYYEGLISDGVYYAVGDGLKVSTVSGSTTTVNVGSGRALIECRWIRNESDLTVDIEAASSVETRIDSIVVKLDYTYREMTIEAVRGTTSPPVLTNTETVKYLRLANVTVPQGGGTLTITDCRGGTECPWVASITPSSSIVYYDNVVTSTTATTVKIGIDEYEPSIDMLEVRLNGISLNPNEYEVSGSGSLAAVTFLNGIESGNEVWFRVVKSLDFQLSQVVNAEEES